MRYYSSNKKSPKASFKHALLSGQASDKGLFMPERIPKFSSNFISDLKENSFQEISFEILRRFVKDEVSEKKLRKIIQDSLNFPVPIKEYYPKRFICYLDRGPTCSFKDFGARILANLLEYFLAKDNSQLIILVATSGDTGGAVASAFFRIEGIKVVILYPKAEVSDLQRKQMTTLGENISAIGIEGKFDKCQSWIKRALNDPKLNDIPLSSANSINIGRLLAQITYYFWSYLRVFQDINEKVIFSVPSGNFGNLMGGILAKKMGLPVGKFIAAVNENDEFPEYLKTGKYKKIYPSINCISSAMNVGHPSNLARIIDLYEGLMDENGNIKKNPNLNALQKDVISYSINDAKTKRTIKEFYKKHKLILDPHGAVALAGYYQYIQDFPKFNKNKTIIFETANAAKFPSVIENVLGITPEKPNPIRMLKNKQEVLNTYKITNFNDFRDYLKEIIP